MAKPNGKKRKRLNTKTADDIRRYLAQIAIQVENGDMETSVANTLQRLMETVLKSIRTDEQQQQLDRLEDMINNPDKYTKESTEDFIDFLEKRQERAN